MLLMANTKDFCHAACCGLPPRLDSTERKGASNWLQARSSSSFLVILLFPSPRLWSFSFYKESAKTKLAVIQTDDVSAVVFSNVPSSQGSIQVSLTRGTAEMATSPRHDGVARRNGMMKRKPCSSLGKLINGQPFGRAETRQACWSHIIRPLTYKGTTQAPPKTQAAEPRQPQQLNTHTTPQNSKGTKTLR